MSSNDSRNGQGERLSLPRGELKGQSALAIGGLCLLLAAGCAGDAEQAGAPAASDDVQAFTNARVYDGTGAPVMENATIVVSDGRIVSVGQGAAPEGAEVVDLGGRFVMPGMINAHAHVESPTSAAPPVDEQLDTYAYYGVTTVLSQGEDPQDALALRSNRESPDLQTTRLYASGLIYAPSEYDETSVDSAQAHIDALADANVDWVKIRVDSNLGAQQKMPPEVYQAVISRAQEHGIPVAVHLVELEDAKGVIEAGASLLSHSVRDQAVDQELITMMRERDVCVVPTLTRELSTFVYADRPDFLDDPFFLERAAPEGIDTFPPASMRQQQSESEGAQYYQAQLPVAEQNMIAMHEGGIGIAMGTDSGPRFPGRFQGYLEHLELEMMSDAGMAPEAILRSATGEAASCLNLEGTVGTLQPGAWADFIALDADPLQDIRNTREIHGVWIAGNQVR